MLEHSRGVTGERRSVDINGLIDEALNLAYHGARAQDQDFNITLERDFGAAITPIELVPRRSPAFSSTCSATASTPSPSARAMAPARSFAWC
jgi:hypothetical protein